MRRMHTAHTALAIAAEVQADTGCNLPARARDLIAAYGWRVVLYTGAVPTDLAPDEIPCHADMTPPAESNYLAVMAATRLCAAAGYAGEPRLIRALACLLCGPADVAPIARALGSNGLRFPLAV